MSKIQLHINSNKAIQLLNELRYDIPANYENYTYKAYYNGIYQDVTEKVLNFKEKKFNLALESFMRDTLKGGKIRKYFIPETIYNEKNDTSYDITFYQLHNVNGIYVSSYVKNKIEKNEYVNTNYVDNQGYTSKYLDSVVYRMYDKERNTFIYIEVSESYEKVIFILNDVQNNNMYEFNIDYITRLNNNKNREDDVLTYNDLIMLGHDLFNHYHSGQLSKAVVLQLVTRTYDEKDVNVKSIFTDVINNYLKDCTITFVEDNVALLTNNYNKNSVLFYNYEEDKNGNHIYMKLPILKKMSKILEFNNESDIIEGLNKAKLKYIDVYETDYCLVYDMENEKISNKIEHDINIEVLPLLVNKEYYSPFYIITYNKSKHKLNEIEFNKFCEKLSECESIIDIKSVCDEYMFEHNKLNDEKDNSDKYEEKNNERTVNFEYYVHDNKKDGMRYIIIKHSKSNEIFELPICEYKKIVANSLEFDIYNDIDSKLYNAKSYKEAIKIVNHWIIEQYEKNHSNKTEEMTIEQLINKYDKYD